MNSPTHLILLIWTLWDFSAKCEDMAVSNRLSSQLCKNYESSSFGKVLPDSSSSGGVCPVYLKGSTTWNHTICGKSGGDNKRRVGGGGDGEARIYKGKDAPPFSHPYVAFFRADENAKGFSGTIYNRYTILVNTQHMKWTLKQANNTLDRIRIHIGKHVRLQREIEEQLRFICAWTQHPKYHDGNPNAYYVYTAIHLYDPITLGRYADQLPFAKPEQSSSITHENCLLPGWGSTGSGKAVIMLEANATEKECPKKDKLDDNEICTNPVYCWGDTGSPLLCTDKNRVYATAVASATNKDPTTYCESTTYSVYADLKRQDIHDWIEKDYKAHREKCRASVRLDIPKPL